MDKWVKVLSYFSPQSAELRLNYALLNLKYLQEVIDRISVDSLNSCLMFYSDIFHCQRCIVGKIFGFSHTAPRWDEEYL